MGRLEPEGMVSAVDTDDPAKPARTLTHAQYLARVKKGEALMTLEAMKMEHALTAPFDAVVAELKAKAGDQVVEGALLAKLEKTN